MPSVGGKDFSYSHAGQKAAVAHAKQTGQTVHKKSGRQAKMHSVTGPKTAKADPSGWRISKAENGYVVHADYPLGEMLRREESDKPMVFAASASLMGYFKDVL